MIEVESIEDDVQRWIKTSIHRLKYNTNCSKPLLGSGMVSLVVAHKIDANEEELLRELFLLMRFATPNAVLYDKAYVFFFFSTRQWLCG